MNRSFHIQLFLALSSLMLGLASVFFWYLPAINEQNEVFSAAHAAEQNSGSLGEMLGEISRLEGEKKSFANIMEKLQKIIQRTGNIAVAEDELQHCIASAGGKVTRFEPESQKARFESGSEYAPLIQSTNSINFEATFSGLVQALRTIENNDRSIQFQKISISASDKGELSVEVRSLLLTEESQNIPDADAVKEKQP